MQFLRQFWAKKSARDAIAGWALKLDTDMMEEVVGAPQGQDDVLQVAGFLAEAFQAAEAGVSPVAEDRLAAAGHQEDGKMSALLKNLDAPRIVAAIKDAERDTAAEIFAVVAKRSDDYRFVAYTFFAFWILIVSAFLALWIEWEGFGFSNWGDPSNLAPNYLPIFIWSQIAALLSGMVLLRLFPGLAVLITPRKIAHERSHANAVNQFLAHGIHHTKGRTGVLIFVSLEERYAEIIVDRAIEEKTGREFFFAQLDNLIASSRNGQISEGYCEAIKLIGEKLAEDFPPDGDNPNEIEDKLILL